MKYSSPIRYLGRAYFDLSNYTLSARDTQALVAASGLDDLVHAFAQLSGQSGGTRNAFVSTRTGWQIVLGAKSIDVMQLPKSTSGENMHSFSAFADETARFLAAAAEILGRKASRLALVSEGMLEEMSPERMTQINASLTRPVPFFIASPPFEWTCHWGAEYTGNVDGVMEQFTCLLTVKRVSGMFTVQQVPTSPFDRIRVDLDISTSHLATEERIEPVQFASFFRNLMEYHGRLKDQISAVIYGAG